MPSLALRSSAISGDLSNIERKAPQNPISGTESQTTTKGRRPRTRKTAVIIPQKRKIFRQRTLMVFKTWALIMALSTLLTTSKTINPIMTIKNSKHNLFIAKFQKCFGIFNRKAGNIIVKITINVQSLFLPFFDFLSQIFKLLIAVF